MRLFWRALSILTLCSLLSGFDALAHSNGPLGKIGHDLRPDPAIKTTYSLNFDFAGTYYVSWSPPAS